MMPLYPWITTPHCTRTCHPQSQPNQQPITGTDLGILPVSTRYMPNSAILLTPSNTPLCMAMPLIRTLVNLPNTRSSAPVQMAPSGNRPMLLKSIAWPRVLQQFPGPTPCSSSQSRPFPRDAMPLISTLYVPTDPKKPFLITFGGLLVVIMLNMWAMSAPKWPTLSLPNSCSTALCPHLVPDA